MSILLSPAANKLGIRGPAESLALRTTRQEVQTITGSSASFQISPITQPQRVFRMRISVDKCFYVNNCLQSLSSIQDARKLVDKSCMPSCPLEALTSANGLATFPEVVGHLPLDTRSATLELTSR
ncbi:uncharacterized protein LOC113108516 [Tachysurus ichikawai]